METFNFRTTWGEDPSLYHWTRRQLSQLLLALIFQAQRPDHHACLALMRFCLAKAWLGPRLAHMTKRQLYPSGDDFVMR